MRAISYSPISNSGNRGIYWETTWGNPTTQKIALDDQTDDFYYGFLIMNTWGCVNPSFPYIYFNSTSGQYVCYSSCPSTTYGIF
jgi:hypothetical protein